MDKTKDFEKDFIEIYSEEELNDVRKLIDDALETNASFIKKIGLWSMYFDIEKHDQLNFSYHISLSKDDLYENEEDEEVNITFYTGIDVGCELVDYSFDGSSILYTQKTISILDDIQVDWSMYNENANKKLIQSVLDTRKDEIMEIYKKQNYDNYVTGGTNQIDKHYKEKFNEIRSMGLYWKCIYKDIEVDRNIL